MSLSANAIWLVGTLAVGLLGGGGVLGWLGTRAQQIQQRSKDLSADNDQLRVKVHRQEDYIIDLRRQLTDAGLDPKDWPDD